MRINIQFDSIQEVDDFVRRWKIEEPGEEKEESPPAPAKETKESPAADPEALRVECRRKLVELNKREDRNAAPEVIREIAGTDRLDKVEPEMLAPLMNRIDILLAS